MSEANPSVCSSDASSLPFDAGSDSAWSHRPTDSCRVRSSRQDQSGRWWFLAGAHPCPRGKLQTSAIVRIRGYREHRSTSIFRSWGFRTAGESVAKSCRWPMACRRGSERLHASLLVSELLLGEDSHRTDSHRVLASLRGCSRSSRSRIGKRTYACHCRNPRPSSDRNGFLPRCCVVDPSKTTIPTH